MRETRALSVRPRVVPLPACAAVSVVLNCVISWVDSYYLEAYQGLYSVLFLAYRKPLTSCIDLVASVVGIDFQSP